MGSGEDLSLIHLIAQIPFSDYSSYKDMLKIRLINQRTEMIFSVSRGNNNKFTVP